MPARRSDGAGAYRQQVPVISRKRRRIRLLHHQAPSQAQSAGAAMGDDHAAYRAVPRTEKGIFILPRPLSSAIDVSIMIRDRRLRGHHFSVDFTTRSEEITILQLESGAIRAWQEADLARGSDSIEDWFGEEICMMADPRAKTRRACASGPALTPTS